MKYRIIESVVPEITKNYRAEIDFIPKIEYRTTYIIQEKESFIHKWMNVMDCNRLEAARIYLKFLKTKKITRVVE